MEKHVWKAVRGGGPEHPHARGSLAQLWDARSLGLSRSRGRVMEIPGCWGGRAGVSHLGQGVGAQFSVRGVSAAGVCALPVPSPLLLQAV